MYAGEKKNSVSRVLIYIALIIISITIAYPFFYMVITALKPQSEYFGNIFGLPRQPTMLNFRVAIERFNVLLLGRNSLVVASLSVFFNCTVSAMAAYSFSKLPFKGSKGIMSSIVGCMIIPGQMLMIPVYIIISKAGLINTFTAVILFYVATGIPFAALMLKTQCDNIPDEIIEAAEIDGTGPAKMFFTMVVPFLKPALITLVILNFMGFWNELLYAMLFLQGPAKRTLTVEIATAAGRFMTNVPMKMSGLLLNSIPTILIFIFFQKYISKGLTLGAIK